MEIWFKEVLIFRYILLLERFFIEIRKLRSI